MPAICVAFSFWVLLIGGVPALEKGTRMTMNLTSQYMPLFLTIIPTMAFGSIVANEYGGFFQNLLSGRFGFVGAFLAAFFSPTSSAFAGFVKEYWANKELRTVLLYFLTVTPLVSYNLFIIRQMGLGAEIAATMYKVNFISAVWLLPFFWAWNKWAAF